MLNTKGSIVTHLYVRKPLKIYIKKEPSDEKVFHIAVILTLFKSMKKKSNEFTLRIPYICKYSTICFWDIMLTRISDKEQSKDRQSENIKYLNYLQA